MPIQVTSAAFTADAAIPRKYTGEGADISPPIEWSGVPPKTQELALICDDPDAPSPRPWVHWVLYGLRPDCTGLAEGKTDGAREGRNDFGRRGYGGPMPPPGHGRHRYHFKVYALDAPVTIGPGASKEELLRAIEGHVLDEGELIGTYARE